LRFIPQGIQERTLHRDGFDTFLANEVKSLLHRVEEALNPAIGAAGNPFPM
jgi:hypothetical protein